MEALMMPMALLGEGEIGQIVPRSGPAHDRHRGAEEGRVEDMGLRAGKRVEMLSNAGRSVLVKVDESRIAVARGLAMRIAVRRIPE
jgi:ferrous iron transport protein A